MEVFKQIAAVVFAVLFLGIFAGIYSHYRSGSAEAAFERDAEELAQHIRLLADKDVGSQDFFDIDVPSNCQLSFEDNSVVALVNTVPKTFDAGVLVFGDNVSNRKVHLTLERVENGVSVYG